MNQIVYAHRTRELVEPDAFDVPPDTAPMEARPALSLPPPGRWQYEPKWDGFRCLAFRAGERIELTSKSGKPLGRYFPEVVAMLRDVPVERFVVDGELMIELHGRLSFDALQARLHPAQSRVRTLAASTPARMMLFDILARDGGRLIDSPLTERRRALEAFAAIAAVDKRLMLSPRTVDRKVAKRWLDQADPASTDGIIAKRLDAPYEPGMRAMIKVKRLRTADCVIGGFRYQSDSNEVGSLLLGLYDEAGLLDHIGAISALDDHDRADLTRRLEPLREPPGFTGKAPGGRSRWNKARSGEWEPLRPELVVEARFDHVTGDRLRHGAKLMRWRPDKAPRQCTLDQIRPPSATAAAS
jgi:ATP-dependent DNA ligase